MVELHRMVIGFQVFCSDFSNPQQQNWIQSVFDREAVAPLENSVAGAIFLSFSTGLSCTHVIYLDAVKVEKNM